VDRRAPPRHGRQKDSARRSPTARAPAYLYEYDFGDLWEHEARVEAMLGREAGKVCRWPWNQHPFFSRKKRPRLGEAEGKPIIDSTAAAFWKGCRLAGVDPVVFGWGALMRGEFTQRA
jgi:hypothetical protein